MSHREKKYSVLAQHKVCQKPIGLASLLSPTSRLCWPQRLRWNHWTTAASLAVGKLLHHFLGSTDPFFTVVHLHQKAGGCLAKLCLRELPSINICCRSRPARSSRRRSIRASSCKHFHGFDVWWYEVSLVDVNPHSVYRGRCIESWDNNHKNIASDNLSFSLSWTGERAASPSGSCWEPPQRLPAWTSNPGIARVPCSWSSILARRLAREANSDISCLLINVAKGIRDRSYLAFLVASTPEVQSSLFQDLSILAPATATIHPCSRPRRNGCCPLNFPFWGTSCACMFVLSLNVWMKFSMPLFYDGNANWKQNIGKCELLVTMETWLVFSKHRGSAGDAVVNHSTERLG